MRRLSVGTLMAVAGAMGLPQEPILRAYDRPRSLLAQSKVRRDVANAEHAFKVRVDRRRAAKKAAKASRRRNRR